LSSKIQIALLHHGRAAWNVIAPIEDKYARKMTKEELETIGKETVAAVMNAVEYAKSRSTAQTEKSEPSEGDRKKRR
jgi:hypothetical protein